MPEMARANSRESSKLKSSRVSRNLNAVTYSVVIKAICCPAEPGWAVSIRPNKSMSQPVVPAEWLAKVWADVKGVTY